MYSQALPIIILNTYYKKFLNNIYEVNSFVQKCGEYMTHTFHAQ